MTGNKKTGSNKPDSEEGAFIQIERGAEKEELFEEISCRLDDMCEEDARLAAARKASDDNRIALNRLAQQITIPPVKPPPANPPKNFPNRSNASKGFSSGNPPSWPIKNIPPLPRQPKSKILRTILLVIAGILLACAVVAVYLYTRPPSPEQSSGTQVYKIHPAPDTVIRKKIIFPEKQAVPTEKPELPAAKKGLQDITTVPPPAAAKTTAAQKDGSPSALAVKPAPPPPEKISVSIEQEVERFLTDWKTAWENTATDIGNIDAYMDFYSENFEANGFTRKTWRRDKALKNRYKAWIKVDISNIRIAGQRPDGPLSVTFTQGYRSSNYQDQTEKKLILQKEKESWKIIGL